MDTPTSTDLRNAKLFTPVKPGRLKRDHRVIMAPLTRLRTEMPGNIPNDLMATYYTQRATRGGYLEGGIYNAHLKKPRAAMKVQHVKYKEAILRHFPEIIKLSSPFGGFIFWIEFPEQIDITEMQKVALMKGISFCPGHIFLLRIVSRIISGLTVVRYLT